MGQAVQQTYYQREKITMSGIWETQIKPDTTTYLSEWPKSRMTTVNVGKDVEYKRPPSPHSLCWEHRTVSCFGRVWKFLTQLNIRLSVNLTSDF